MKRIILWTIVILCLLGVTAAILVRTGALSLADMGITRGPATQDGSGPNVLERVGPDGTLGPQTVPIMPADALIGKLSASGRVELIDKTNVLVRIDGTVANVAAEIGDEVAPQQLLLTLETAALERELARAQVDFDSARIALEKEASKDSASEIAAAEAELRSAQEELATVSAGPTAEEIQAAESKSVGAWAAYNELLDGPTVAQINESQANLRKAEVELGEAQSAYNEIKWMPQAGSMSQAATLQKATIDFEAAQASFENVNKPSATSDLQNALSNAQSADDELNKLRAKPTVSELAAAEAALRQAEKSLTELHAGTGQLDIQTAELTVKKALIDLESAQTNLESAQVIAPIAGTVIELDAEAGQTITAGTSAVAIADLAKLKIVINVAEADAHKISLGQRAEIKVDALRNQQFSGTVSKINPVGSEENNVVTFPVTILLDEADLGDVRAKMSASVVLENEALASNSWLVPQNAIQEDGGRSSVTVVTEEGEEIVDVTAGEYQGEWIVVQSDELEEGDEVVGSVASFVDAQAAEMFNE